MIRAKFVGMSDDFFTNGTVYNIIKTWVGNYPTENCNYGNHQYIWVKFGRTKKQCAYCGSLLDLTERDYMEVPYGSLSRFLENWEVIYE